MAALPDQPVSQSRQPYCRRPRNRCSFCNPSHIQPLFMRPSENIFRRPHHDLFAVIPSAENRIADADGLAPHSDGNSISPDMPIDNVRRHACRIHSRQQRLYPVKCFTAVPPRGIGFRHAHQPAHFEVRQLRHCRPAQPPQRRDNRVLPPARNVTFDVHP